MFFSAVSCITGMVFFETSRLKARCLLTRNSWTCFILWQTILEKLEYLTICIAMALQKKVGIYQHQSWFLEQHTWWLTGHLTVQTWDHTESTSITSYTASQKALVILPTQACFSTAEENISQISFVQMSSFL